MVGSWNTRSSGRSEPAGMRIVASVFTTISLVTSLSVWFSAAVLPLRTGMRTSRTPRAANPSTISSVRSVEASDITMISRRSAG